MKLYTLISRRCPQMQPCLVSYHVSLWEYQGNRVSMYRGDLIPRQRRVGTFSALCGLGARYARGRAESSYFLSFVWPGSTVCMRESRVILLSQLCVAWEHSMHEGEPSHPTFSALCGLGARYARGRAESSYFLSSVWPGSTVCTRES